MSPCCKPYKQCYRTAAAFPYSILNYQNYFIKSNVIQLSLPKEKERARESTNIAKYKTAILLQLTKKYRYVYNYNLLQINCLLQILKSCFERQWEGQILKYNYLFWLITVIPFKIDLKSFPRSAFVSINTSSARLVSC